MFKYKENEYKKQLIEIKGTLDQVQTQNPNFYEDGVQILELMNLLYSQYVKANNKEKAKILKMVASNYTLRDGTPCAAYRKPFIFFAEMKGRPNWLPR